MIERDKIIELAIKSGFLFTDAGHAPILHTLKLNYSEKCFERFAQYIQQELNKE